MSSQVPRVNWNRPEAEEVSAWASGLRLLSWAALASRYLKLTPDLALAALSPCKVDRSTVWPARMTVSARRSLMSWTMDSAPEQGLKWVIFDPSPQKLTGS